MPCGHCGGTSENMGIAATLQSALPELGLDGWYVTNSDDDCTGAYDGPNNGRSLWVVGFGTDSEVFFTRAERSTAIYTARSAELTIDHLPCTSLCQELVVSILGA